MVCAPMASGPPDVFWQPVLALDVVENAQEPSLCFVKSVATLLVRAASVTPSSCHVSWSVSLRDEGSLTAIVIWLDPEQVKVGGGNVTPPEAELNTLEENAPTIKDQTKATTSSIG